MKDKVFLDSNILVYSYSSSETDKQFIARQIITENSTVISTQVLHELCNVVTKKFRFSYEQASAAVEECCRNSTLYINTESNVLRACSIAAHYGYSFYDSLIVAASIESGCNVLFSEDMRDGQIIDNMITIKNPFRSP